MTLRLVLATHNAGKVAELGRILAAGPDRLRVELLSAGELDLPDVEENGDTFLANALLKARAAAAASGLPAVADDSGLVVAALGGAPGIRSARYAGCHGDDLANLNLVLENMIGQRDHAARFVCAAALVAPDGREWHCEGVLEGELVTPPRGQNGFGYDPIFQPLGHAQTTAQMEPACKDEISHRGKAFRALRAAIAQL